MWPQQHPRERCFKGVSWTFSQDACGQGRDKKGGGCPVLIELSLAKLKARRLPEGVGAAWLEGAPLVVPGQFSENVLLFCLVIIRSRVAGGLRVLLQFCWKTPGTPGSLRLCYKSPGALGSQSGVGWGGVGWGGGQAVGPAGPWHPQGLATEVAPAARSRAPLRAGWGAGLRGLAATGAPPEMQVGPVSRSLGP